MLQPKKVKYKKMHRGNLKGKAYSNNKLAFGKIGLCANDPIWITSNQIEAARKVLARTTKRQAKIWIKVFPDKSITQRAAESRMGSGKGNVSGWVAVIRPNTLIFEMDGLNLNLCEKALKLASHKLPKTYKIIYKND